MAGAPDLKHSYVEGREAQFREMMQALSALEGKYKGVRGELLAKVHAELMKLKPTATGLSVVEAPGASYPPCRVCGREMKLRGSAGELQCQNGHVAHATGS